MGAAHSHLLVGAALLGHVALAALGLEDLGAGSGVPSGRIGEGGHVVDGQRVKHTR